jgi:hypothetical protein
MRDRAKIRGRRKRGFSAASLSSIGLVFSVYGETSDHAASLYSGFAEPLSAPALDSFDTLLSLVIGILKQTKLCFTLWPATRPSCRSTAPAGKSANRLAGFGLRPENMRFPGADGTR